MNIRSKLALGLSVSTLMLSPSFRRAWPLLTCFLTALPLAWILSLKRWRMALVYCLILALCYLDRLPGLAHVYRHLPWPVLLVLSILQQLLPGMTLGLLIIQTTSISQYMNGLRRLRIPAGPALATSVIFRFIPTIREENAGIKQALIVRGWTGFKAWRHPIDLLNYRLAPLLLSTSRIADELSMASLCRGLSTERERTSYPSDDLHLFDWLLITFSGLLILLWLGTLSFGWAA